MNCEQQTPSPLSLKRKELQCVGKATLVGALSDLLRDSALEVGLFSRHGVAGPASKGSFLRNISVAHLRSSRAKLARILSGL